jgi:transcription antitermination factor NusG
LRIAQTGSQSLNCVHGQKVSVVSGPYAGMEVVFDQNTSAEERVIILLDIMAALARVKIDRQILANTRPG